MPIDGGVKREVVDVKSIKQIAMTLYWKLKEYEDLEEQGRLLKLPCKVGDEIFFISKECPKDYKVGYCRDHEGGCENCHHIILEIASRDFRLSDLMYDIEFYVTRDEAEQKLKELEAEKD